MLRRVAPTIALASLAALVVAHPAGAEKLSDIQYAKDSVAGIVPNTQARYDVDCPPQTQVVGGGVYMTGSTLDIEVAGSGPFDGPDADKLPDDGWRGQGNADSVSEAMTVHAYCAGKGKVSYTQKSKALKPGKRATVQAPKCPGNTSIMGGGVLTKGDSIDVALSVTLPVFDKDTWYGQAANDGSDKSKLTAYATCGTPKQAGSSTTSGGILPDNSQGTLAPTACNPELVPVSGGGAVVGSPPGTEIATIAPQNNGSDPMNTGFEGYYNNQSGAQQSMVTVTVCVKN